MSKQPLSYHLASFDFCLTNVNPLLAQVGLYFSIFGHDSGPACFYSSILIIIKKPEFVISVLNVTILCMFPGTKWQLISVVIILIIDFLVLVTQLLYQVRHWIIYQIMFWFSINIRPLGYTSHISSLLYNISAIFSISSGVLKGNFNPYPVFEIPTHPRAILGIFSYLISGIRPLGYIFLYFKPFSNISAIFHWFFDILDYIIWTIFQAFFAILDHLRHIFYGILSFFLSLL